MTHAIATFDIKEFLPSEFRFDGFAFVFTSEGRDFEQEISYQNKNQISHRFFLLKKDLKYSIKVTKNGSLIGLCDLSIPQSITSKRETNFEKICPINMTDSIRRVLFGSPQANITLKINVNVSLQYKDKEKIGGKLSTSTSLKKDEKVNKESGNLSKKIKSLDKEKNTNLQQKNITQKKNANLKKQTSGSKAKYSTSGVGKQNVTNKNPSQKELNIDVSENQNVNDSDIDDEINKPIQNVDSNFLDFMKNFERDNPLDKVNQFNNVSDMVEYTKNNIEMLLEYQTKYYELLKNNLEIKNKLKNLLTQYNEKYRLVKKKLNKLNEDNDITEFESNILYNPELNDLNQLIPQKEAEFDIYQNIYNNYLSDNVVHDDNNDQQVQTKQINDDATQSLLVKVLSHIIKNYGPVNNILTQSNSIEPERVNLRNLVNKYNLNNGEEENNNEDNLNHENEHDYIENNGNVEGNLQDENEEVQGPLDAKIEKWEYVSTNKPDKIDAKLENYLKFFYSKRTFPKIIFRKTSSNNYEYGTQKVMIKIEGDTIRVRYVGGYSLIDKFIEINAALEEGKEKKKLNNQKNSGNIGSQYNPKKKTGKSSKGK